MVDMLECYFTNGKIARRAKEAYGCFQIGDSQMRELS